MVFKNISVLSWRLVLFVEETRVSGENLRPAASHLQTLSHTGVLSTPHHKQETVTTIVLFNHNISITSEKLQISPHKKICQMEWQLSA